MDRWRRRGWSRRQIAAVAETLAARLHADGVGAGERVGLHLQDGPLWAASFFGVLRCGATAVPVDVSHPRDLVQGLAGELGLTAWVTERELPRVEIDIDRYSLDWRPLPPSAAESDPASITPPPDSRASRHRAGAGPGRTPAGEIPWPDPDPDRVAQVVLTSGTTRRPRPVEVTHRNLRTVLDALAVEIERYRWAIRLAPRLRLAVALPFSHLYGQVMGIFLPPLLDADVAAVATLPAPELARALRRERAWALAAVPHGLQSLAKHLLAAGRDRWGEGGLERRLGAAEGRAWPRRWLDFDPLRRQTGRRLVAVVSGGASLDPELEALWRRLGYLVVQGYGLTEAAPLVTLNHPLHPAAGSIGKPLPGIEVRLADDGEILVRGANVTRAAAGEPRVDDAGWLHTGDLGRRDADGTIRFVGRKSERIVTPAGVNVDPDTVAAELRQEPGVSDAVVLERPWGEPGVVAAVLLLGPGGNADVAVGAANSRLPDAARVRDWHVWPHGDLPRTPTGKPRRGQLVAWLRERARDRGHDVSPPEGAPETPREPAEPAPAADAGDAGAGGGGPPSRLRGDPRVRAVLEVVLRLARREDATDADVDPSPGTRLGEALTSLQRVELAAVLEETLDTALGDEFFDADRTLEELAAGLPDEHAVSTGAAGDEATASGPPSQQGPPPGPSRPPREENRVPAPSRRAQHPRGRRPPRVLDPVWRHWRSTRILRWSLRELVMRPLASFFVRLDVEGAGIFEQLQPPFVLAVNHVSMMDPVLLFALPRAVRARVSPAARWSWFSERRAGDAWYRLGVLGLNLMPLLQTGDWRRSLRIGGRLADRGDCLLVYPEGRISPDGRPRRFQSGVALVSRELHLPIVPAGTAGLQAVLPRGHRWPRRGLRRPRVRVRFGEPLPPVRPDDDVDEVTRELEQRVRRLHREARDATDGIL